MRLTRPDQRPTKSWRWIQPRLRWKVRKLDQSCVCKPHWANIMWRHAILAIIPLRLCYLLAAAVVVARLHQHIAYALHPCVSETYKNQRAKHITAPSTDQFSLRDGQTYS